jgi:hypothetical protein
MIKWEHFHEINLTPERVLIQYKKKWNVFLLDTEIPSSKIIHRNHIPKPTTPELDWFQKTFIATLDNHCLYFGIQSSFHLSGNTETNGTEKSVFWAASTDTLSPLIAKLFGWRTHLNIVDAQWYFPNILLLLLLSTLCTYQVIVRECVYVCVHLGAYSLPKFQEALKMEMSLFLRSF